MLEGARRVAKAARRLYASIEADKRHSVSPTQAFYLDLLAKHGKLTITELAELAHVTLAAASQMVTRLETRGLARRGPSLWDERTVIVRATAHGKWALGFVTTALRTAEEQWSAQVRDLTVPTAVASLRHLEVAQVRSHRERLARADVEWWLRMW